MNTWNKINRNTKIEFVFVWIIGMVCLSLGSCNKQVEHLDYVTDHVFYLKDNDGKELANVAVELYYNSPQHGLLLFSKERTDSEGKIEWEKLDAGDYQIEVHVPHVATQILALTISSENMQTLMRANTHVLVPSQLFMVGTATPGSSDLQLATPLQSDPDDPLIFIYNSVLEAGDFYFLSERGKQENAFYKGSSLLVENLVFSPNDDIGEVFTIPRQGIYKITVDFNTFVLTVEEEGKDFIALFAKGSAVPNGISRLMTLNRDRVGVFHFNEILQAGEFHISTLENNDANSPHFTSIDENGSIDNDEVRLVAGEDLGYKWQITETGAYKITFDLVEMKINIVPYTPLTDMWIMGNAVGAGFTINPNDALYKLKPVDGDSYSYYYQGSFGVNPTEFKILLKKNSGWDVPYYMPAGSNRTNPFVDIRMMYEASPYGPRGDRKWSLPADGAGTYRLTINQLKETIDLEKL